MLKLKYAGNDKIPYLIIVILMTLNEIVKICVSFAVEYIYWRSLVFFTGSRHQKNSNKNKIMHMCISKEH